MGGRVVDQLSPHIYSNSSQCRVCMLASVAHSFEPFQWLSVLHAYTQDQLCVLYTMQCRLSTTACKGGWMQHVGLGGD